MEAIEEVNEPAELDYNTSSMKDNLNIERKSSDAFTRDVNEAKNSHEVIDSKELQK